MKRTHVGAALAALLVLATGACDDDPVAVEGPFDLTFSGDATFQDAHGGQTLRVAVVSQDDGNVVVRDETEVSTTGAASFTFTFLNLLEEDTDYEIRYWIDSNFDDGSVDVCDETNDDHQWVLPIGSANNDRVVEDTHRPGETADVCTTFAADLTFQGDATFQTAHGGQTVSAAVVRSTDGAVLWIQETTVSGDEDPSFSFSFPGALMYDDAFEIHYWIDSNFAGGTQGTCDPPANDHQWAIDIGQPDAAEVVEEDTHRPTETESVCSTFE